MPKIPQPTAPGAIGAYPVAEASPNAFGAQAGHAAQGLAQSLFQLDAKQRDLQDKLDLSRIATDYETQLHLNSQEILAEEPDIRKHAPELAKRMADHQTALLKDVSSGAVRTAFQVHAESQLAHGQIALATEGRKLQSQRQVGDYAQQSDVLTAQAAANAYDPAKSEDAMAKDRALRTGLVQSGAITPEQGVNLAVKAEDRRWSIVSQKTPELIIGMLQRDQWPESMDPQKQHVYVELAFQSMAAHQKQDADKEKADDKLLKETQQENERQITGKILAGDRAVISTVPGLVRSRDLTADAARTLDELHRKVASETTPDLSVYDPQKSVQLESMLGRMKFAPTEADATAKIEQVIKGSFLNGTILKPEYQHLMAVWEGVQEHKNSAGKEGKNAEVGHAHSNLVRSLQTTGPADKFDALANQTIEQAEADYYRQMVANPEADPWQIKEQVEKRYKPVIKERLNLSRTDELKIEDAKQAGALSPAAYKAWHGREQERRGYEIVQETLTNLPPPKDERSFIERYNPFSSKTAPATPPKRKSGTMGR